MTQPHEESTLLGPIITPTELSALIEIPTKTLAAWRYQGHGPRYLKLGGHVRYRQADIQKWLDSKEARQ